MLTYYDNYTISVVCLCTDGEGVGFKTQAAGHISLFSHVNDVMFKRSNAIKNLL